MNSISIIALSISVFAIISVVFNIILYNKVLELLKLSNDTKRDLEKIKEDAVELVEIEPGDNGIISDFGLSTKDETQIHFKVTYEVEILEVSVDSLKVKVLDYTSTDSYAKDPANKNSIINFMNEKWVKRDEVELIMDTKKRRNIKLNKLGI